MQSDSVGTYVKASKGMCGKNVRLQNHSGMPLTVLVGNEGEPSITHEAVELAPGQVKCLPKGNATKVRIRTGQLVQADYAILAYDPLAILGLAPPIVEGIVIMDALEVLEDNVLDLEVTPDSAA